jgi:hypothetical protein
MNSMTGFVESDLLLAIVSDDEETVQEILKSLDEYPGAKEKIHQAALKLYARTHEDAKPENKRGVVERYI